MTATRSLPTSATEPALQAQGLGVSLGGRSVLADVDFAVYPGELVGLFGPNGAGKTTFLRTLLGLISPAAGQVRGPLDARRAASRVAYVPQKHNIDWDFPIDIRSFTLHGRAPLRRWTQRYTAADQDATARALTRVGLAQLATRPIAELSGGQRQRALIARALVCQPDVLLLDEPFTGVDATTQDVLLAVLAGQRRDGVAVIMTTHDLPQMVEHCTRAVLINGRIFADGDPIEVARSPHIEDVFGSATARRLRIFTNHLDSLERTARVTA